MLAEDMNKRNQQLPATLIVGLGKTGLSCADFLAGQGIAFAVADTRDNPPGLEQLHQRHANAPCFTGGLEPAAVAAAEELVVSPGISVHLPELVEAERQGKRIIGDVELFARYAQAPVLAITGTNGKSTVTDLLGAMATHSQLHVRVGGNIGTPVLDLLPRPGEQVDLYVLEVSSFQLETTSSLNAAVAVLLNISEDHMDRYSNIGEYQAAKERIFNGDGAMVINLDDPRVAVLGRADREIFGFTLKEPGPGQFGMVREQGEAWLCHGEQRLLPVSALKIRGAHNYANSLAALAAGHAWGLPMQAMLEALRDYRGLAHRMQCLGTISGVDWYNDSKATNVGAAVAAVNGVDQPVVLIAGGDGKGQDFSPLAQLAPRLRALVTIGRDGSAIAAQLAGKVRVEIATDMEQAVLLASQLAKAGDCVLLSPACASFDMFRNYEHRGEEFSRYVQALEDKA